MGKQIHLENIEKLFKKSPVVDFKSIELRVKQKSKNKYSKLLVFNLLKKGKIKRLCKGFYTKNDEISLSVFCFKPSYLGLQCALSAHGLWEQETINIIITTKKVRCGIRKVMDKNIFIRKISNKYFFGIEYLKEGEFYLPYSDIEKTFIDMVYYNQNIEHNVLKKIKNKIDYKKLNSYLKIYPANTVKRVKEKLNYTKRNIIK